MDFNASLRRAIKTGTVILGQHNTQKSIQEGKVQIVVVAQNCPEKFTRAGGQGGRRGADERREADGSPSQLMRGRSRTGSDRCPGE